MRPQLLHVMWLAPKEGDSCSVLPQVQEKVSQPFPLRRYSRDSRFGAPGDRAFVASCTPSRTAAAVAKPAAGTLTSWPQRGQGWPTRLNT